MKSFRNAGPVVLVIAVIHAAFASAPIAVGQTVTVEMWYESTDGMDHCPKNESTEVLEPVTGSGSTCEEAIGDALVKLDAICTSHDGWYIMLRGDCLSPSTAAITRSGQASPGLRESAWDAIAVYWCTQEESEIGSDGSVTGELSKAAAIIGAINDLKANNPDDLMCGEEEPYPPIIRIKELNENPELDVWIVEITYKFGNGRTITRIGRGRTLAEADCRAWLQIAALAKENGGIVSGSSRATAPGVRRKPVPPTK